MTRQTFLRSFYTYIFLFLSITAAQSQSGTGIMKFFSAHSYDRYRGKTRIALVQQLQDHDWLVKDSMYGLPDQIGHRPLEITKTDLAPYVDEAGYIVYWVPEVAPEFPGGKPALQQYKRDVLGPLLAGPEEETQASVYIRCTIAIDGTITDVAEAQSHSEWIPVEVITQCLDAVRYMPAWSPGVFREKAVRTCVLVEFSLK